MLLTTQRTSLITIFCIILSLALSLRAEDFKKSKSEIMQRVDQLVAEISAGQAGLPDAAKKNVIAIGKFENKSTAAEKEKIGDALAEIIQSGLAKNKSLIVVENDQVDKLMKEIEKSMTGLIDEQYAKVAGRMAAADLFLFGSVSELGNDFVVTCRLVEVETAKIMLTKEMTIPKQYLTPVAGAALLETKAPINAGLYSLLIPGWGQFYNRNNTVGAVLLSAAVVSLGTLVTTRLLAYSYQTMHDQATDRESAQKYFDIADNLHQTANMCTIAYGTVWLFGIVHAIATASSINARIQQYKQANILPEFHDNHICFDARPDKVGFTFSRNF